MNKTARGVIIPLLVFSFLLCAKRGAFALEDRMEEILEAVKEPSVLAPEGLEEKERTQLERGYRYTFRHKDIIGESLVTTPFAEEPSAIPMISETMTEDEKLYRYFGIASVLYKIGRFDEAKVILEYLISKRPKDQYLRQYLTQVEEALRTKKIQWLTQSRKDAMLLKEIKIKELMDDGVAYYRQKRFDLALLKFSDALTFDPGNALAKNYVNKLKQHYLKEAKVESIIRGLEADINRIKQEGVELGDAFEEDEMSFQISHAIDTALDKAELKEKGALAQAGELAERMLNEEEMGQKIIRNVTVSSIMDEAEMDLKVDEVITQTKEEEKRRNSYTLGPGDEVGISVQDHPEISGSASVGPNGDILLPLVNEPVRATGITAEELREEVTKVLKRYVKDPIVYTVITGYRSKIFYVIDEIGCTPYNVTRANFTLRDALFIADWGSNRALGRIIVMKPHKLHPVIKKVDGFDIIYRGNLSKNIKIENGDVIYIPLTAANKISSTIADALSPFKALRDIRAEWIDWRWDLKNGWYNLPRIPRDSYEAQTNFSQPTTTTLNSQ